MSEVSRVCPFCTSVYSYVQDKHKRYYTCEDPECKLKWKNRNKNKFICPICGDDYYLYPSQTNRTCKKVECKNQWRLGIKFKKGKEKKQCPICGDDYFVKPSQKNTIHTCPKPECKSKYQSENYSGENCTSYKGYDGLKEKRYCPICNTEYSTYPSQDYKTCPNPECMEKWRLNRNKENSIQKPKTCPICGKIYPLTPCQESTNRTCGELECRSKWRSENSRGEKSPSWKGGDINQVCEVCGEDYPVRRCEASNRHTCGEGDCVSIWKSMVCQGITDVKDWTGYATDELYCSKFTPEFKNRQYEFQNYTCLLCGKHVDDPHCHHVYWQKSSCCFTDDDNGKGYFMIDGGKFYYTGYPDKYAVLCNSCHGKTGGKKNGKSKLEYIKELEQIIIGRDDDKSYFTREEYWGNGYYKLGEREIYYDVITGDKYGKNLFGFQGYGLPKLSAKMKVKNDNLS